MRFRILGHLEVQGPDGWTAINAAKWRSLLACLLVRPGQLVPTESLIFELWGDNPPSTANNMVSIYVHRLRKEVIGDAEGRILVRQAPGYLLRIGPGDVDIQVFEALVGQGRSELAAGRADRAAELLGEALGLWRGPLLADVPHSPALVIAAERATERWLDATELRIEADLACDRAAQLVAELRGLVADHPLRERLWALLVRALDEAGRRAEAFEAYALARRTIADELGVEPGSELQRLYAELLAADASSASGPPASAARGPRRTPAVPPRPGPAGGASPGKTESADDRRRFGSERPRPARAPARRPLTPSLRAARYGRGPIRLARSRSAPSPTLVWSGPPPRPGRARQTPLRDRGRSFRVPPSSRPTSGTSPAARRRSSSCARCCSARTRRAIPARCASPW